MHARRFAPFSDYQLEEYVAGVADPADAHSIERAAAQSGELARYLAERRAERAAFLLRHPRLERDPRRPRLTRLGFSGALLAACAAAAVMWLTPPAGDAPEVRVKGGARASIVVQRDGRTFPRTEGVLLRPGDKLRLVVDAPRPGFVTVVARDRQGFTALYDAVAIAAGETALPGSWVLDDTPGPETWFVLIAEEASAASRLQEVLRQGSPIEVPLTVLTLDKEPAP